MQRKSKPYSASQLKNCLSHAEIPQELYREFGVYKGLRDLSGKGVLTGLTNISSIVSSTEKDGIRTPCDGELLYRGYNIKELISGSSSKGMLFEEGAYLLLFGELPTEHALTEFKEILENCRTLPTNFTRDVIMKAPSGDIMNNMTRSMLTLAAYDKRVSDLSTENTLRQCIELISVFPLLAVYGYHAYNHYSNGESMYIHRPASGLSVAETILQLLRPDEKFTPLEATVLDALLLLHMEHGGGNNSTFTLRVVTSAGTDTYSAFAAALSSLKGSKHGGANLMVSRMIENIKANVSDCEDYDEVEAYIDKILRKEAFDGKGLIYGMGHAVYSISDPREVVLKRFVNLLADDKGRQRDMALYGNIERAAVKLISKERRIYKGVCANVDFYSGFVYDMLNIPSELYTPLFAIARVVGWSAHRIEELINADKIIRPSYQSLVTPKEFVNREDR